MLENNACIALLLIAVIATLPYTLELIGETTRSFHFLASQWICCRMVSLW